MKNDITQPNIDLVYLWVDGSDPKWQAKRSIFIDGNTGKISESNCKGRYANNDELKYSLRSAEKYAPWIRKIFIVTDDQTPDWLDITNPKINIIDHKEIMPEKSLPCFNSRVIEYFIHRIPDLSEHFLYANDDMFFNAYITPDFFFESDGFPIVRLKRKVFGKLHYWSKFLTGKKPSSYKTTVYKASILVEKKCGKYYAGVPHHNINAYKKTDCYEIFENVFWEQTKKSLTHRSRTYEDLSPSIILYYTSAIGHGHLKYVDRQESKRISAHKADFMEQLLRYQPKLLCLNDSQRVKDEDRERIMPFLEKLFPKKSAFEK